MIDFAFMFTSFGFIFFCNFSCPSDFLFLDCYVCSLSFVLLPSQKALPQSTADTATPGSGRTSLCPWKRPAPHSCARSRRPAVASRPMVAQSQHLEAHGGSLHMHGGSLPMGTAAAAAGGSRSAGCGPVDGAQFWPAADPATWVFCRLRGSADSPRPFTRQRPQIRSPVVFHRKRRFTARNMTAGNRRLG